MILRFEKVQYQTEVIMILNFTCIINLFVIYREATGFFALCEHSLSKKLRSEANDSSKELKRECIK